MARTLVQRSLAACVQISPIESVYQWQGAIQQEQEFRLALKTTAELYPAVEALIRELHPYEVPAIFSLEVKEAAASYCDWIQETLCSLPEGNGQNTPE